MTVEDLYLIVLKSQSNEHMLLEIGVVTAELGALIYAATGITVFDFVIAVDNYGIRHALERHGDPLTESKKGQVALQQEDFVKMVEIVTSGGDSIKYDSRGNEGAANWRQSLIFEQKTAQCVHFVAMEIRKTSKRGKTSRLVFQTMYIKKVAAP